jgi:hypothetical protein
MRAENFIYYGKSKFRSLLSTRLFNLIKVIKDMRKMFRRNPSECENTGNQLNIMNGIFSPDHNCVDCFAHDFGIVR